MSDPHEFLIFTIFAIFPAIRENNSLKKINENIFPAKTTQKIQHWEIVSVQLQLVSSFQKQNGIQWIGFI